MIPGCDHVDAGLEHALRDIRCEPKAVRGVLTVCDHEVSAELVHKLGKTDKKGPAAGLTYDVTHHKGPQVCTQCSRPV